MNLLPVSLNVDGSIEQQPETSACIQALADLRPYEHKLRLWDSKEAIAAARRAVSTLRERHPQPWLTFTGSGDLHHLSLLLIESLPESSRPLSVVLIDNHPDWFLDGRRYDCGNWLGALRKFDFISEIIMLGLNSPDLNWYYFYTAPFRDLCRGKYRVHPYSRKTVRVPLRRCACAQPPHLRCRRRWWGSTLDFQSMQEMGVDRCFVEIGKELAGKNVYLTIDKDCLDPKHATTDWDQGALELDQLLAGVKAIAAECTLVGADITGEHAPAPLSGLLKRLDAGRCFKSKPAPTPAEHIQHDHVNQALLSALTGSRA